VLGSNDKSTATPAQSRRQINTAGSAISQNTQTGGRRRTAFGLSEIESPGRSRGSVARFFGGIAATVKQKKPNQENNIAISDGYSERTAVNLAAFASAFGWLRLRFAAFAI
jgi:hypothetical protein